MSNPHPLTGSGWITWFHMPEFALRVRLLAKGRLGVVREYVRRVVGDYAMVMRTGDFATNNAVSSQVWRRKISRW